MGMWSLHLTSAGRAVHTQCIGCVGMGRCDFQMVLVCFCSWYVTGAL